ncbi:MAG: DNA repair protein RecO [candidate division KSB1 bacterium]|nr:DNA repair protein RecO [candidate division KSB1 bacterium]MDZ7275575.1 DNA repair protein RecO [candidate division KSB1 bacterium]MDZ7284734.1 DNA repair protein RecO [candidate division KSB1 bacterium]MDZ7297847.1 DNA repair protein RecO [candidate division KSB1 bacterium]MDZ7308761.1 DNA repair protein RecO [candidate division KSB1 bacterium]
MAIVKAEGIVIHTMKVRESSKLVTLFTREHGLLKLEARAARTSKSRLRGSLELFSVVQIVYYEKENRSIQFLSHADLLEIFPELQHDLERLGYASACCELIRRTQAGAEPGPQLYPLLLETLRVMNTAREPRLQFWGFEMKLLGALGLAPNLKTCLFCRAAGPEAGRHGEQAVWQFHVARGGFACPACAGHAGALPLSGEALRLLASFQALPAARLQQLRVSPPALTEIAAFFRAYLAHHLEEAASLTSLQFLRQVTQKLQP